ncbi:hypothetical protein [Paenibacillus alginolyticus]|uniref:Uncharacterized protein n=1 Tax=Paenibacillus alginolyticus TaxID=59839 RepID=A0ABT4GQJ1_9BACL|nr:hypothetical protein [Paenibacillus alginolyticus]MCY9698467.1 hypothetical protein [Paenibacillus alginolyticus]MEC0148449.1 hypothetical protein [Paenibacillus alginolyticus]
MWIIKTEHKRDEDGGTVALELETDGCTEIHVYSVTEENRELKDTFHTCDLIGFIDTLQTLDNVCQDYFGEGSYWERKKNEEE